MREGRPPDVRVLAAVVEREGRWLVGRRPPHKRHGGLWEFPGGKIRDGESDLGAAGRELAEELGLAVVAVGATLHRGRDPGSAFVIEFVEVAVEGEPRPTEHTEIRWCTLAELEALDLSPSDARFVAEVLAG